MHFVHYVGFIQRLLSIWYKVTYHHGYFLNSKYRIIFQVHASFCRKLHGTSKNARVTFTIRESYQEISSEKTRCKERKRKKAVGIKEKRRREAFPQRPFQKTIV